MTPGRYKYAIRGYLQLNLTSMSDCPWDCGLQNQLRFSKMQRHIKQCLLYETYLYKM